MIGIDWLLIGWLNLWSNILNMGDIIIIISDFIKKNLKIYVICM